jgi:anti-sigma regulatory factor (Ser/Thr protein kinase)
MDDAISRHLAGPPAPVLGSRVPVASGPSTGPAAGVNNGLGSLIGLDPGREPSSCERRHGKDVVTLTRHHQQTAPDTPERLDVRLQATRTAATKARRALSQLRLPLPLAFDAQVLVSELVSNSVRHAGLGRDDLIRVTAHWSGDRLVVHVRDGGEPTRASPVSGSIRPTPGAESGWGLYLVDRLASRWGTTADGYWFELRHEQPPQGRR